LRGFRSVSLGAVPAGARGAAVSAIAVAGLFLATAAFADNPFTSTPLGTQNVLVILVEYPEPPVTPCPNSQEPCPPGIVNYFQQECGSPRHTPAEWQALLNSIATSYWQASSYNQTNFQFTVLSDPDTSDGWWPAPHSPQDYWRNSNGGNWSQDTNNPPSYAMVPDVTASVAQSICSNPILALAGVCQSLATFNRLLVIQNFNGAYISNSVNSFGAQTYGNDVAFEIPTGTSLGTLTMTATWANEDFTDNGVTAILHELGHQLGHLSHYGNCSNYFADFDPSIVTPPAASPDDCIGGGGGGSGSGTGWDIMGISYTLAQTSGYSKVSRGFIDPSTAINLPLPSAPFSKTVNLGPLENPPSAGHPNLIMLPVGGGPINLSTIPLGTESAIFATFSGYYVECRQNINGEAGNPSLGTGVGGLYDQGILITNVHEASATSAPGPAGYAPAYHVERASEGLPGDQLATATLQPGQSFSNPSLKLKIKFNGYGASSGSGQLCNVTVTVGPAKQTQIGNRPILFAGAAVLNGLSQAPDSGSIPLDLSLGQELVANDKGPSPIPVNPPWVGHNNIVTVRVHNGSMGPVHSVQVGLSANQPALISDPCMAVTSPAAPEMGGVLKSIDPLSSAVAAINWTPTMDGSTQLDATASGPVNKITSTSRFAFQFHHLSTLAAGMSTQLQIAASSECSAADTLFVDPAFLPAGWQISASPKVMTLKPGQTAMTNITVVPPSSAMAGDHAEIPIVVRDVMVMPTLQSSGIGSAFSPNHSPGQHFITVGALTILARVTGGPGTIGLMVPATVKPDATAAISGAIMPGDPNSPITVEYSSPQDQVTTHIVLTNSNGVYEDKLKLTELGSWTIKSRWAGDFGNDPVESLPATVLVTNHPPKATPTPTSAPTPTPRSPTPTPRSPTPTPLSSNSPIPPTPSASASPRPPTTAASGSATATPTAIPSSTASPATAPLGLVVADTSANRVLVFPPPLTSGQNAGVVLGQPGFSSQTAAAGASGMNEPVGAGLDSFANLWVADFKNNRLLGFAPPFANGMNAVTVIGQANFSTTASGTSSSTLNLPGPPSFDAAGDLWVGDWANNRVLEFVPQGLLEPQRQFSSGMSAQLVIGQSNLTSRGFPTVPSPNSLSEPSGLAFDSHGYLYVTDQGANRVLQFQPPFSNDMSASVVFGQPNFTSNGSGCTANELQLANDLPTGTIAIDPITGNLAVADRGGTRVVVFQPPFTSGMNASVVLGQPNLTTCVEPSSPSPNTFYPFGVAYDPSGNLYVVDQGYTRILVFPFPQTNNENATIVVGQPNFSSHGAGASQNTFVNVFGAFFHP
jgi:hypothetical protein